MGKGSKIIIARDSDYISNMIKRSITNGIMSAGVNIIDAQVIPIPILRQELKSGEGTGGIFVRKSPFDRMSTDIIFDNDGRDLVEQQNKGNRKNIFQWRIQESGIW